MIFWNKCNKTIFFRQWAEEETLREEVGSIFPAILDDKEEKVIEERKGKFWLWSGWWWSSQKLIKL